MAECLYYGDKPIGLIQSNADDVEYSTGVSVKDKIDDVVVDLSGYKHVEFRGTTASFSAGKATITHNLGKDNTVIPLPNGGLIPFAVLNTTQNSFEIQVVWVKSANVADSQMATNYTGNYGINYFLVY